MSWTPDNMRINRDGYTVRQQAQLAAAQERFADMWRIATEAAFSNRDDRCCFCNTQRGRLHEADCAFNAWQHNAAALAAAGQQAAGAEGGEA